MGRPANWRTVRSFRCLTFTTGTLRAVDASNGNVLGKLTGYPNISAPIISNGHIYINSQGNIFAIGL